MSILYCNSGDHYIDSDEVEFTGDQDDIQCESCNDEYHQEQNQAFRAEY